MFSHCYPPVFCSRQILSLFFMADSVLQAFLLWTSDFLEDEDPVWTVRWPYFIHSRFYSRKSKIPEQCICIFFKFNTEQKNSFENAEYTVMRRGILDRQNIFVEDFYKVQTMFSQRNNYRDFIRVCSSIASMIITSKINSANIISNVS